MKVTLFTNYTSLEGQKLTYRTFTLISILLGVAYYVVMLIIGEVPKDEGDGLQHFAIAQESWNEPTLFLDHWGKPFFILLSSTFSQFGFNGYVCFNILVFLFTCLLAQRIFKELLVPETLGIIFPWILISIPDYSYCIIGGMTEPLFGFMLLFMLWFALNEKWFLFALIASFAPFARSEGMLVTLASMPYLLLFKQWKHIPALGIGFVAYCIVGWILLDQPMWYFENNPYPPKSIYGSGPWYAYLKSILDHLGIIAVLLMPFSFIGWWFMVKRKSLSMPMYIHFLFFIGIYLGIIFVHSYLWANGLRGALGLSRIATLGLVPTLVFILFGFRLLASSKKLNSFHRFDIFACLFLLIAKEVVEIDLPTNASPQQEAIALASDYVKDHEKNVGNIYYLHPLVAYYQGRNTMQKDDQYHQKFVNLRTDTKTIFKPGDLIIRDSKFGAFDQGLPFEKLQKYPWIVPVKHFYTSDFFLELNGEPKSVIIYEVMDKTSFNRKKWDESQKTILKPATHQKYVLGKNTGDEYYNIDTAFTVPVLYGPRQELSIAVDLNRASTAPIYLIFQSTNGYYLSLPFTADTKELVLPFVTGKIKGLLFIHNPSKEPYELTLHPKNWKQTIDSGIQRIK